MTTIVLHISIFIDPKDVIIIEDDSSENHSNQDEALELVTDVLQESRNYLTINLLLLPLNMCLILLLC